MTGTDKYRTLLACCRPDGDPQGDRRLKGALQQLTADPALRDAFAAQVGFDKEMGARVRGLPLPPDFAAEVRAGLNRASTPMASTWRGWLRQPALWAGLLGFAFLAAWGAEMLYERARGFPGDENVRAMVETALTRNEPATSPFQPLVTETGKLGDTLFLQFNLDQYEVPAAFAHAETIGYRVFEKNDSPVTQVQVRDHHMTLLVFRADAQGVDISPAGTWKVMQGEGWTAAAEVHNTLGFVAICKGDRAPLDAYLRKAETTKAQ